MFWLAALLVDRAGGRGQAPIMARKVRLQDPDGICQLMHRGDRREAVFSGLATPGRRGEDRPGAADAVGNDDATQMDLRPATDGILEIRPSEAL